MKRKPRITKPRLKWARNRRTGEWEPYHRVTWTENGKQRERAVLLKWKGNPELLDTLYWQCEAGRHDKQKPTPAKHTWGECVELWKSDLRIKAKLAASTKASYARDMDLILAKNQDKAMSKTTKAGVRKVHDKLGNAPRKADKYLAVVSLLWNYARDKKDWRWVKTQPKESTSTAISESSNPGRSG